MKTTKFYLLFLTILVVVSLVFSLIDTQISTLFFSLDKVFTFIGVIVSSFALVIGVYFALLAVSAYSHIKNIQLVEEKMNRVFDDFIINQKTVELCIKDYANTIYDEINDQLANDVYFYRLLPKENQIMANWSKRKEILMLKRARLSYRYPMLNLELRQNLVRELVSIGNQDDIKPLQNLCASNNENAEMKKIARFVLGLLISKYASEYLANPQS